MDHHESWALDPTLAPAPALAPALAPARLIYLGVLFIYLFGGILLYGGSLLAPIGPIGSYWLRLGGGSRL